MIRSLAWLLLVVLGAASCQPMGLPPPEVAIAKLPPDYMASKRETVGNMLLTSVLAYQAFRPMVVCPNPDCVRDIERVDEDLQKYFQSLWKQLFIFPAPPPSDGVDWGEVLKNIMVVIAKLAKYMPVMKPLPNRSLAPEPIIPGIPQLVPQSRSPVGLLMPPVMPLPAWSRYLVDDEPERIRILLTDLTPAP